MGAFLRKYATGTGADIYIPLVKRAVVDFAVGADYTPSAGDVKISIDGGAAANIGTLPVAVAMGNTAYWKFVLSDSELTGKKMTITVADAATKAVEDQAFNVETFGHASAAYAADLSLANLPANVVQNAGSAITSASGIQEVKVASIANNAITAAAINDGAIDAATFAANAITATVIADNAITDAKVASDVTIASVTGAVGSVTGNVGGNVTGSVGSVATGGIAAASFAANAIDSAALAASAVTEIQSGLATSSALATAQTSIDDIPTNAELATALGTADDAVLTQIALIRAKTDNLPSDPADESLIIAATDTLATLIGVVDGNVDLILADTGTDGVVLSAAQMNKIADHVRRRQQANVESSSDGDSLSLSSHYGAIQQIQESANVGGTLTVYRTDGTTSLGTKSITSSASADPMTGIS